MALCSAAELAPWRRFKALASWASVIWNMGASMLPVPGGGASPMSSSDGFLTSGRLGVTGAVGGRVPVDGGVLGEAWASRGAAKLAQACKVYCIAC